MNAIKLIEMAEWLQKHGEVGERHHYERLEDYFRKYEVGEREEWLFNYALTEWGFHEMMDIVFGKSVYDDGFEGLEQAAKEAAEDHISRRSELGHSRKKTFKQLTDDKPHWFIRELAQSELDEAERNYETEYAEFLREFAEE